MTEGGAPLEDGDSVPLDGGLVGDAVGPPVGALVGDSIPLDSKLVSGAVSDRSRSPFVFTVVLLEKILVLSAFTVITVLLEKQITKREITPLDDSSTRSSNFIFKTIRSFSLPW